MTEAELQQLIRIEASKRGIRLFRNNCGAFQSKTGQWVRYGLANDSKKVNKTLKSSDLIGITPVIITPDMTGKTVGIFTSYEVKSSSWKYRRTEHEIAQRAWLDFVLSLGGIAKFINRLEDL